MFRTPDIAPPTLVDPVRSEMQPQFWPGPDGRPRAVLVHQPAAGRARRGAVLQAHAWAEEMNKSRAMVARTARALADEGWLVVQLDLLGCGDSAGDLDQATVALWAADLRHALQRLAAQCPEGPLWLWAHRFGALPAVRALADSGLPVDLLLWHPVLQGRQQMQQFLRLKAAAQLADGGGKAALDAARAELAAGRTVEVAGYPLSAAMHASAQDAVLDPVTPVPRPPGAAPARLVWLEVAAQADNGLSPAAAQAATRWQAAGWTVHTQVVAGPVFWQTTEIEAAPALTEATLQALAEAPAPGQTPQTQAPSLAAIQGPAASCAPTAAPDAPRAPAGEPALRGLRFACQGEQLTAVLHPAAAATGVLVVVGGPQYRVGSHRQFVHLARGLQQAGWPVLRFDLRGMGDSTGPAQQPFDDCAADLGAAVDAFCSAQPQLRRVVLWGLCDGASAALMYLQQRPDARVAGLCLVNPWVRSADSLARTQVRHYYLQRLASADFWRKLLTGGVARGALGEFLGKLAAARRSSGSPASSGSAGLAGPSAAGRPDAGPPGGRAARYQDRMLAGWRSFRGPSLLVLSGQDYTAREFEEYAALQPAWQARLAAPEVERLDLPEADHTLSSRADQQRLDAALLRWLARLDPASAAAASGTAATAPAAGGGAAGDVAPGDGAATAAAAQPAGSPALPTTGRPAPAGAAGAVP